MGVIMEVKKRLGSLIAGTRFRYIGSDNHDWHIIVSSSEDKVIYTCGHKNETNTSVNVVVLVEAKTKNLKKHVPDPLGIAD